MAHPLLPRLHINHANLCYMFIQFHTFQVFSSSYCDPLLVEILYKTKLLNLIGLQLKLFIFFCFFKTRLWYLDYRCLFIIFYYNFVFILIGILLTNIFFIYISINIPPLWFFLFSLSWIELFLIILYIFNFLGYYFDSFI